MKKYSRLTTILFITALIPTAVTLIAIQFLPDEVPAHYDFNMNITRWGSKYESLLTSSVSLFMAPFMYVMARYASKQENGESNQKVTLISGIILNLFFTAMTAGSLALDFRAVDGEEINGDSLMKIIFICMGLTIAAMGNFLPKCKMNSVLGLRTSWSMANEDVWFKCQRFGGLLFVICGIIIAVLSAVLERSIAVIAAAASVAAVMLVFSIVGSKVIYDRTEKDRQ